MENLANNQTLQGFGSHNAAEIEELQKALSIGSGYADQAPGSHTGGTALAVEDLDRTLKLVTHSMEHLRLWKDIIKQKTNQVVSQYNVQNSYGAEVSPFFTMGGTPTATDAAYDRETFQVKYLGTQGSVHHNLTLMQAAHGPVVAREVKNKTIELLARNERAMFEADSSINALEYDGIDKSIRDKQASAQYKSTAFSGYESAGADDTVILDAAGGGLDEDLCEDACLRAVNNFGMPKDMYLATDVHSHFSRSFYAKERTAPGTRTAAGMLVPDFAGTLNFNFKPSLFNRPRKAPLATGISLTAAPTVASGVSPADVDSNFAAADAGTYSYKISSVYADGETAPTAKIDIAVAAGDKVTAEITFTGTPLYFNVFRAPVGTVTAWEFIGRVAKGTSGAAHDLDFNDRLEGSGRAYLLSHDPDILVWKQMGSLLKYDLAVTNTSYQWLQLLYGAPQVSGPRKNIIIDNVKGAARVS